LVCATLLLPANAIGEVVGSDDFESGTFSSAKGGLSWLSYSRNVYVVTDPVTGKKTIPAHGSYSAGFSYRAKPPGEDGTAELRFSINRPMPDIYLSYNVRIPDNFYHRPENPGNSKWLMLWTNGYEDRVGVTVGWEYWPTSDSLGASKLAYRWVNSSGGSSHKDLQLFMVPDTHRGRWMTVVIHVRLSSSADKNDGVVEFWRRLDGAAFERIHYAEGLPLWPSDGPNGFTHGYLMGWSNSGYSEETTFHIDDFVVSDTWPVGTRPNPVGSPRAD
jgi:hypothetical protein